MSLRPTHSVPVSLLSLAEIYLLEESYKMQKMRYEDTYQIDMVTTKNR